jgi:hypothetical protein
MQGCDVNALLDALAVSRTPGKTTRDDWYAKQRVFRTYASNLKVAGREPLPPSAIGRVMRPATL